eukprot:TRINITY_DN59945_c0_g1_i1.p1 TRINITY_DN59945_c0_g1~~TRINITY_DN59945_c0_g1_i1.p1  ORF type:complete len:335 (-),score=41.26 TRINITY_DN59945_c0_g1_i1:210-1115(-)
MTRFSSVPVLVSLLLHGASGANVSCAVVGKAYNDSSVRVPSYLADAAACQAQCAAQPSCTVFTYYSNKQACWTLTENATAFDMPNASLAPFAISGPKSCNESRSEVGTVVTDGESSLVSGSGTERSIDMGKDSTNGSGGVPTWLWLLGAALLLVCCGGAGMYFMGDTKGEEKDKKKKKSKDRYAEVKNTRGVDIETPARVAPAGLPQMAPVPTISQPVPQGAPVQQQAFVQYVSTPLSPQNYAMQPQMQPVMPVQYAPVQQGYEYELPSQPRLSTTSAVSQIQGQMAAQPVYMMRQGYEQA